MTVPAGIQEPVITSDVDPIELEEAGNPATPPIVTPQEQKAIEKLERSYKLKVNGKEIDEKIDLNDEAELVKRLQLAKASGEAFQRAAKSDKELAQMNQQLDQFFKLLQENPLQILMNPELGLNAEEIANKILDKRIEEEMKSPEQKELEEAKAKIEKYEKARKDAESKAEALRMEKLAAEVETEIETSINSAIDKGDLPKSPYILAKFGQLMEVALDNGIDLSAEDLIPIVKNAYKRDMREMSEKMSDDELEEMMTPERIKNIRTKRIAAVRAANAKVNTPKIEDTGTVKPSDSQGNKKKDPNFWKKFGQF